MGSRNCGIVELESDVEGFLLKSIYLSFTEDSLGLVGRFKPTEFGMWIQRTRVLMAGVLGGCFGDCHPSNRSCM